MAAGRPVSLSDRDGVVPRRATSLASWSEATTDGRLRTTAIQQEKFTSVRLSRRRGWLKGASFPA